MERYVANRCLCPENDLNDKKTHPDECIYPKPQGKYNHDCAEVDYGRTKRHPAMF